MVPHGILPTIEFGEPSILGAKKRNLTGT